MRTIRGRLSARYVAISARRCYNNGMGKNFRHNRARKVRDDYTPKGDENALATPLAQLGLTERTAEILQKGGVATARDLAVRRMRDMYRIQNIGKKQCLEVKNALAAIGLDYRPDEEDRQAAEGAVNGRGDANRRDARREDRRENKNESRPDNRRDVRREVKSDARRDDSRRKDGKEAVQDNGKKDKQQQRKGRDAYAGMSLYEIVFGKREPAPVVEPPQREPLAPDAILKFNRKGKWGYRDRKGNVVIQPEYDDAFEFCEGLACVEKDGKLGYIDKEGKLVVDFRYDAATSFEDGLASVTIGEKSGYIDKEGNEATPLRFDVATPFEDGRAIVREDGRWGVLDRKTLEVLWR